MSLKIVFLLAGAAGLLGIAIGYILRYLILSAQKGSMELQVKQSLLEAKDQAQKIVATAEAEANKTVDEAKAKAEVKEAELKKREDRLINKDELLDKRQTDIDKEADEIKKKIEEVKEIKERVTQAEEVKKRELERVAHLSTDEAKQELINVVEKNYEDDILSRLRKLEIDGADRLEQKAKEVMMTVVQRLSTSTVPEVMSTIVDIASDDLKGKIIGKEGRNIRAFEKATGVEVIIDDTPGSIVLSSFDPVRRQ
ncbi:MAG: Rnase Y domain-containing protein, partial [Candidatus Paceibacterota bacterium]